MSVRRRNIGSFSRFSLCKYVKISRVIDMSDDPFGDKSGVEPDYEQEPYANDSKAFAEHERIYKEATGKREYLKWIIPGSLGLLYGLVSWLTFTSGPGHDSSQIVSFSFMFGVPFVMGGITTLLGYRFCGQTNYWTHLAPMLTLIFGLALSVITQLEATLCAVVALPIMLVPVYFGGLLTSVLLKKIKMKVYVSILVFLPYLATFVESLWEQPQESVEIKDSIRIDASSDVIWKHIASVEEIQEEELPFQWIYILDFPKPKSAEIDKHGVGGIRLATFERDVTFFEEVTEWDEGKKLSFSIHADPEFIPQSAFDQHIIVGGRFYDVLDGMYEIEQKSDHCILHLTSNHRLSSPFNSYAGFWSEWVMNQIQGSILTVIKNRCEAE